MTPEELVLVADGITDTLASIDAGALDATPVQRAYLAGALHALRVMLGESDASFSI
jgi:ABC-type sugar transport system substrate-binding protein